MKYPLGTLILPLIIILSFQPGTAFPAEKGNSLTPKSRVAQLAELLGKSPDKAWKDFELGTALEKLTPEEKERIRVFVRDNWDSIPPTVRKILQKELNRGRNIPKNIGESYLDEETDIHRALKDAFREGSVFGVYYSGLQAFDRNGWDIDNAELAGILSGNIIGRHSKDVSEKYLTEYLKIPLNREKILNALKHLFDTINRSQKKEDLKNIRFVIILRGERLFSEYRILEHAGNLVKKGKREDLPSSSENLPSVYIHIDIINFAEKVKRSPWNYRNLQNGFLRILEHADFHLRGNPEPGYFDRRQDDHPYEDQDQYDDIWRFWTALNPEMAKNILRKYNIAAIDPAAVYPKAVSFDWSGVLSLAEDPAKRQNIFILLERLASRGIEIFVITRGSRYPVINRLKSTGLSDYVKEENVIGGGRISKAGAINDIVKNRHIAGNEIVHFDDTEHEIEDIRENTQAVTFGIVGDKNFEQDAEQMIQERPNYVIREFMNIGRIIDILHLDRGNATEEEKLVNAFFTPQGAYTAFPKIIRYIRETDKKDTDRILKITDALAKTFRKEYSPVYYRRKLRQIFLAVIDQYFGFVNIGLYRRIINILEDIYDIEICPKADRTLQADMADMNKSADNSGRLNIDSAAKAPEREINRFSRGLRRINTPVLKGPALTGIYIRKILAENGSGAYTLQDILEKLEDMLSKDPSAAIGAYGNVCVLTETMDKQIRDGQNTDIEKFKGGEIAQGLIRFFRGIPKADIHHHLDGSISPEVALKLLWMSRDARRAFTKNALRFSGEDYDAYFAEEIGGPDKRENREALENYLKIMSRARYDRIQFNEKFIDLMGGKEEYQRAVNNIRKFIEYTPQSGKGPGILEFLKKFEIFYTILNADIDNVRIAARESALQDFYEDGTDILEQKISIITPGLLQYTPEQAMEAVVKGLIEAEQITGKRLKTGVIGCIWKQPEMVLGIERYASILKEAEEKDIDFSSEKTILRQGLQESGRKDFNRMAEEAERQAERGVYAPSIQGHPILQGQRLSAAQYLLLLYHSRLEGIRQAEIMGKLKEKWKEERPEYAAHLVGIGTVGAEINFVPQITVPVLREAHKYGFRITDQLGETWMPGEIVYCLTHMKDVIETGFIERIGYATVLGISANVLKGTYTNEQIEEVKRLQKEIKELIIQKGIHIECNPSSNLMLSPKYLPYITCCAEHPIRRFFEELHNVSVNTDDSRILRIRGVSGELAMVWFAYPSLTWGEIKQIIQNGIGASFISGTRNNNKGALSEEDIRRLTEIFLSGAITEPLSPELRKELDKAENAGLISAMREDGIIDKTDLMAAAFIGEAVSHIGGLTENEKERLTEILAVRYLRNMQRPNLPQIERFLTDWDKEHKSAGAVDPCP